MMIKKYLLLFVMQMFCIMQVFAFDTNDKVSVFKLLTAG